MRALRKSGAELARPVGMLGRVRPFKCLVILVFLGPDTRDMILTSPPAVRGSGDIARTMEGVHPADDKTEALMTENVAKPKDTRAGCPELGPCPPPSSVGSIKSSHWMPSGYQPPSYLPRLTIPSLSGLRQEAAPW